MKIDFSKIKASTKPRAEQETQRSSWTNVTQSNSETNESFLEPSILLSEMSNGIFQEEKTIKPEEASVFKKKSSNELSRFGQQVRLNKANILGNNRSNFGNDSAEKGQTVNVSLMYPFEVSRSMSPGNLNREIEQMGRANELSPSILEFIKKEVSKEASPQKRSAEKDKSIVSSVEHHSWNKSTQSNSERDNSDINIQKQQEHPSLANTRLFSLFEDTNNKNSKNTNSYSFQHEKGAKTAQNTYKNKRFVSNTLQLQSQKYHQRVKANFQSTQQIKLKQDMRQLREVPSLNMTMDSAIMRKVCQKRQRQFRANNSNVFESLFNEAVLRECKRSIEKEEQIFKDNKLQSHLNKGKRDHVKKPFLERVNDSLEKKKKWEHKIKNSKVDSKTGQQLFKPNTTASKSSYHELFHRSLQKSVPSQNQIIEEPHSLVPKRHKKGSSKQESSSALGMKRHTVRSQKNTDDGVSTIYISESEGQSNTEKRITTPFKESSKNSLSNSVVKTNRLANQRDEKLCDFFTSIFYGKQMGRGGSESFNKSFDSISQLTEQEYYILEPLLGQMQERNQTQSVSPSDFQSLFFQLLKKLNLYDKTVLSARVDFDRVAQKSVESVSMERTYIDSLEEMDESRYLKRQEDIFSHHPLINEQSRSLQKLSANYQKQLYLI